MIHSLVFGASGQVATALRRSLGAAAGHRITALGRADVDLSDPAAARDAVQRLRPDIVINAAAYTNVEAAEVDRAAVMALNVNGPAAAAAAAAEVGAPFIQFSSDYVFDGAKGAPYVETDAPCPLGVYGASKFAGEQAVAAANPTHVVLRTSWVYGAVGANFVRTMLGLAERRDEISVVDDQRGAPTSAADLADNTRLIVERLILRPTPDIWGVFHLAGQGEATWCMLAGAVMAGSAARGGPTAEIKPISTKDYPSPVRRPVDSRLDCSLVQSVYGFEIRPWRKSLETCLDEMIGPALKGHSQ